MLLLRRRSALLCAALRCSALLCDARSEALVGASACSSRRGALRELVAVDGDHLAHRVDAPLDAPPLPRRVGRQRGQLRLTRGNGARGGLRSSAGQAQELSAPGREAGIGRAGAMARLQHAEDALEARHRREHLARVAQHVAHLVSSGVRVGSGLGQGQGSGLAAWGQSDAAKLASLGAARLRGHGGSEGSEAVGARRGGASDAAARTE